MEKEIKKNKERLRARMCEVTGVILTEEKIQNGIKVLFDKIEKWCYLSHDKDTLEDGTLKNIHYHLFLRFNEVVDFTVVAKAFDVEYMNVSRIKSPRYESAIPYLIHANAPEKYQYEAADVRSNFDYVAFIKKFKNKQSGKNRLTEIRELIEDGTIREYNYMDYITMGEYGKYKSQIDRFFKYRKDNLMNSNL